MSRNTTVSAVDSIYDGYLDPRYSQAPSSIQTSSAATTTSTTTTTTDHHQQHHLSLAPPTLRSNNGNSRLTAMSAADTASVYTNATTPYERWSLERGLLGADTADPRPLSVETRSPPSPVEPLPSTQRPPNSPSLSVLRHMPSNTSLPRISTASVQPIKTTVPVAPSPVPTQYPRRHFSRPFRPDEGLTVDKEQPAPILTTPKITVHRFSASTPDAYGGAAFSPALSAASPNGARSSTYSADIAAFPDPTHLRRRSLPANNVGKDDDARSSIIMRDADEDGEGGDPSSDTISMRSVKQALAERHNRADSIGQLSIIESEDESFEPVALTGSGSRPVSQAYPFSQSQNGYGNNDTRRTISHKPSSCFSEDEKRGFNTVSSNNDYHSAAWKLFGRAPTPQRPMWPSSQSNEKAGKKGGFGGILGASGAATATSNKQPSKSRKRMLWIIVAAIVLLAIAGVGTGIGIWRHNVAQDEARQRSLNAQTNGQGVSGDGTAGNGEVTVLASGTSAANPAEPTGTGRSTTAAPGSGGNAGYYNLLAFGGTYADNGHARAPDYAGTIHAEPYVGGRSTNGPVYHEYLASLLGPTNTTSAAILDYAYNGASVNNSITYATSPDIPGQIGAYLGDRDGNNATVQAASRNKTLVTVWAGMEQIVSVWQQAIAQTGSDPQTVVMPVVQSLVATLATSLSWLMPSDGSQDARPDFAIITLPQGDLLPQTAGLAQNNTDHINLLKSMTTAYNTGLSEVVASSLNKTTVYLLNGQSLFNNLVGEPAKYNLTTTSQACMDIACPDPSTFLWYDGFNPTTTIHRLVARRLAGSIMST